MASPGVAFALAINAVILGAGLLLVVHWLLNRATGGGEGSDPVAEWHDEATALAREVRQVVETFGELADHDRVQRRVLPLSERIKGHARSAPAGVEAHVVEEFHALGVDCYEVGMEHTTREAARTGEFLEDRLDDLAASAEEFEDAVASREGDR